MGLVSKATKYEYTFIIVYNREQDSEVAIRYILNLLRSICNMIRQYVCRQSGVRFDFLRHGSCVGVPDPGSRLVPWGYFEKRTNHKLHNNLHCITEMPWKQANKMNTLCSRSYYLSTYPNSFYKIDKINKIPNV